MPILVLFIRYPVLGLLIGVAFFALYRVSRRTVVMATSILWLLYGVYEYGMKFRLLCTGECNIRIDLLAIYPALLLCSLAALAVGLAGKKSDGKKPFSPN